MKLPKLEKVGYNNSIRSGGFLFIFLYFLVLHSVSSQTLSSVSPSELCQNETVTMIGADLSAIQRVDFNGDTYLRASGDFNIITGNTITLNARTPTTAFPSSVTTSLYIDPAVIGADYTRSDLMSIHPLPDVPQNPTGSTFCEGDPFGSLNVDPPPAGIRIDWYDAETGGTLIGSGASFTPTEPGIFWAEAINTTTLCTSDARVSAELVMNPAPAAPTGATGSSYCMGDAVSSVTVNAPPAGIRIDWYDAATGGSLLGSGISYTPDGPGMFYAETFNISTSCVSLSRKSATVTENPIPTNPSGATGNSYCEGDPIGSVSVNAPPAGIRIDWYDAMTGGTFIASGRSLTPSGPGTYWAEAINTTTFCTSDGRVSAELVMNAAPAAPTGATGSAYCSGEAIGSVSVNAPPSGIRIDWYNTDSGGSALASGITFTPTSAGTYWAEAVNISTSCASLTRVSAKVTENPLPANATNSQDGAYCTGDPIASVSVNDPGNGKIVKWYTSINGSTEAEGLTSGNHGEIFTPTLDATATYYAEIENTVTGCISADRTPVKVTKNTAAPNPANATGATYCAGESVPSIRVDDPGTGYTVFWYTGPANDVKADGTSSGNHGEIFTPASGITGTYYAEIVSNSTSCSSNTRAGATITRLSSPSDATNPANASYCAGDDIPSISVNDPGSGFRVNWYTDATGNILAAGNTSGVRGEVFTPDADISRTYYAEVENTSTGCTSLTRTVVTVTRNSNPANATNPVNSSYCSGDAISAVRVKDPGNGLTVKWYTGSVGSEPATGTTSGNHNEIFTPVNDATATYYAEVENINTGCTSPARVGATVTKLPAPFPATGAVGADYCADETIPTIRVNDPGNGQTVVWYADPTGTTIAQGTTSGSNDEIFTPSNNVSAIYYAEVRDDASGCGSTSRLAVEVVKNALPPNAKNPVDNSYCPGKAIPTISVDNPGSGREVFWYTSAGGSTLAVGTRGGLNGEQFTPSNPGTATYYAEVVNETTGCISAGRTGATVTESLTACSDANILAFSFEEQKGTTVINNTTRTISLEVSYGTSLKSLIASFTLSAGATAKVGGTSQESGVTVNNFTNPITYSVTAADGSTTRNWTVTVGVAKNDATDFLAFSIPQQNSNAVINATKHTVGLSVPFGTNLTNIVATFTLSAGATARVGGVLQTSGVTSNNFNNPVTYRIRAEDGTIQDWVVNINEAPNTETDFLTFSFPEISGVADINFDNHTIDLNVVYGTDRKSLVASFTLSPGASAAINNAVQQSGKTVNNFTNPVTYTVKAGDGTTTQNWVIRVLVADNTAANILTFGFPQQAEPADFKNNLITVKVVPGTDLGNLIANFTLSAGATATIGGELQESGINVNDFTDIVTYKITAEDGTTSKNWKVDAGIQDFVDNEAPVVTPEDIVTKFPQDIDSVTVSVNVVDNIWVRNVVFRYKKYQDNFWNEKEVSPGMDSLYTSYIRKDELGSHGMFYYFKAYDLKDNSDSSSLFSIVRTFSDDNSPVLPAFIDGNKKEDYQIVSVPMALDNNSVEGIFDELGPYNIKRWRMYHYNNGITGEYGDKFNTLTAGKSYWLIVREPVEVQTGSGNMSEVVDEKGFGTTLQPGWNQIGNPYNFSLSWDYVKASNENIGRIKLFESGILSEEDTIKPFKGGFVFLAGDQSVLINIPPNQSAANNRIGDRAWNLSRNIGKDTWYLPLRLSGKSFTNNLVGIGMKPGATKGFDKFDEPVMPVPSTLSGFEMFFHHEGEPYERISRDIVSPADYYEWEFEVQKFGDQGSLSFSWDNQDFGQNDYNLILIDVDGNRMIDMRSRSDYTFSGSGNRKFRVLFGTNQKLQQAIMPVSVHVGEIYPNPFDDELFIPLSLPESSTDYSVNIALSDLNGNLIKQLKRQKIDPGNYNLSLGSIENSGLASGMYIIRIQISSGHSNEILFRKVLKN